jgi:hypothetical protein
VGRVCRGGGGVRGPPLPHACPLHQLASLAPSAVSLQIAAPRQTYAQTHAHPHTHAHATQRPQLFTDAFSREHQLLWAEPRQHTLLATALMLRGPAGVGDVQRNVARLRGGLRLAHWNEEARFGCWGGRQP